MRKGFCRIRLISLTFQLTFSLWLADSACALEDIGLKAEGPANQPTEAIGMEPPKIKVDVSLVTAGVTVIGPSVPDFQAADFVIRDNDSIQEVSHFSRDQIPLAIALVIDRSASIRRYLPQLQKAAISALERLKPGDQVALFAFDDDLLKLSDLTEDRKRVSDIVGKLTIGLGTAIRDAMYYTARYLRVKAPYSRRAIILISDNCDTAAGGINREMVEMEVLDTGATLYAIQTPGENYAAGTRLRDPGCRESTTMVKKLAGETGGEVLDVNAPASLHEALERAMSRLRLQYTLGFSPSDTAAPGSYHRLTVALASADRCPGCRLLARRGYYSGVSTPLPTMEKGWLDSGDPLSLTNSSQILRIINSAESIDFDLPDIPINARVIPQRASNGMLQFRMDFHVDFSHIGFQTIGNRRACRIHLAIYSRDSKGNILASDWRILEGVLREDAHRNVLHNGWAFSTAIPAVGSKVTLRVVAYDEGSESLGSKRLSVR